MRNIAVVILLIIAVALFIVHQKGWISDRFFNRINSIATFIAAAAALMVFFIPAAQESKSINSSEAPITPPQQTVKPVIEDTSTKEPKPQQAAEVIAPSPVENKIQQLEEEKSVSKGNTQKFIDNQITISVEDVTLENQVYATIGSYKAPNIVIKGKKVGAVYSYTVGSDIYKIRIIGVSYIGSYAQFMVTKLPKAQTKPLQKHIKSEPNLTSSINKYISDYYSDVVFIEANDTESIIVKGHTQLTKLIQFCPEEWVDNCGPNIEIQRKGDVFKLNKDAVARHQNAFNLKDANGSWLQIRSNNVSIGSNIAINKGSNGSYFVYRKHATN